MFGGNNYNNDRTNHYCVGASNSYNSNNNTCIATNINVEKITMKKSTGDGYSHIRTFDYNGVKDFWRIGASENNSYNFNGIRVAAIGQPTEDSDAINLGYMKKYIDKTVKPYEEKLKEIKKDIADYISAISIEAGEKEKEKTTVATSASELERYKEQTAATIGLITEKLIADAKEKFAAQKKKILILPQHEAISYGFVFICNDTIMTHSKYNKEKDIVMNSRSNSSALAPQASVARQRKTGKWCGVVSSKTTIIAWTTAGQVWFSGRDPRIIYSEKTKVESSGCMFTQLPPLPRSLSFTVKDVIISSCRKRCNSSVYVLTEDNKIYAVGANNYGCLARPENELLFKNWIEITGYNGTVKEITASDGYLRSFAVITDSVKDNLWVCGFNKCGNLGIKTRENVNTLTNVKDLTVKNIFMCGDIFDAADDVTESAYSTAIDISGRIVSAGFNDKKQLCTITGNTEKPSNLSDTFISESTNKKDWLCMCATKGSTSFVRIAIDIERNLYICYGGDFLAAKNVAGKNVGEGEFYLDEAADLLKKDKSKIVKIRAGHFSTNAVFVILTEAGNIYQYSVKDIFGVINNGPDRRGIMQFKKICKGGECGTFVDVVIFSATHDCHMHAINSKGELYSWGYNGGVGCVGYGGNAEGSLHPAANSNIESILL